MKVSPEKVIEVAAVARSASEAAMLLGIKYDTYRKYAIELGCFNTNKSGKGFKKRRKIHKSGYELNDSFFDTIDTDEKAYFLGFMAADASINHNSVVLNVSRKDREILVKLCELVGYDVGHIDDDESYYCIDGVRVDKSFDTSRLQLSSSHMVESLSKYNIIQNKSNIDVNLFCDALPKKFLNAWLVGYIDGDGHISNDSYCISITSNKLTILEISKYIQMKCDICGNLRSIGVITDELNFWRKQDSIRLLLLYMFGSPLHLSRKYDAACSMLYRYVDKCGNFIHIVNKNKRFKEKNGLFSIKNYCVDCGKVIDSKSTRCRSCASSYVALQKGSKRPSKDVLKKLLMLHNFCEIGRMYNVSDNAVRKWCKFYGLPYHTRDIRFMSDDDWNLL